MPDPLGSLAFTWPFLAVFIAAYVLGSIPFGLILVRLAGGGDGFTEFARVANHQVSPGWLRDSMLAELRQDGSIRLVAEQRIRLVE